MFNDITLNTDWASKLELYGYIHKALSNSGMFVLALCYNCSCETKSEQIAFFIQFVFIMSKPQYFYLQNCVNNNPQAYYEE